MPTAPARPPRQRLSEERRREQIIRATVEAVAAHGYAGASLSVIAERAGVSKGLVSHHFSDKDSLMEQAVLVTGEAIRAHLVAQLDLTARAPDVIRAAVRRVARLATTHRVEMVAIREITGNLRRSDGSPGFTLAVYEGAYSDQERLFRRGQAEGSLRPFDTRVMAATYQGALDTMLGYVDAYPETDIDAYAESLADLLVAAMSA